MAKVLVVDRRRSSAPDRYLPLTPEDLSAGRDPGLAEAVRLVGR